MKKFLFLMAMLSINFSINCSAADFVFYEAMNSRLLTKSGSPIGKGTLVQTMLGVEVDRCYLNVWGNQGFPEGQNIETDLVVGKRFSLGEISGDLNFQRFMAENGNENMLEIALKHKGDVTSTLIWTKQITGGISLGRNRLYAELSNPVVINKLVLTPFIATAYLENFYHATGLAYVTPGLRVYYPLSKNISFFAQGAYQNALMAKKLDLSYGSGGIKVLF